MPAKWGPPGALGVMDGVEDAGAANAVRGASAATTDRGRPVRAAIVPRNISATIWKR